MASCGKKWQGKRTYAPQMRLLPAIWREWTRRRNALKRTHYEVYLRGIESFEIENSTNSLKTEQVAQ
jgi:hypothetical protein